MNNFKEAVLTTDEIKNCYRQGLQSLNEHSTKVVVQNTRELSGSVAIDDCTKTAYPDANRWDYIFGYKGEAFFMEVHPAQTSEVAVVLKKFYWLIEWLRNNAPKINELKPKDKSAFYWVQSEGYNILRNSPQERAIIQKGLRPVARIKLN
ncbi:MAG: hypothetical protein J0I84_06185 [Terrimonas sp.]|uniref:hypothetical protein n=1 Tax=uncultured Dysgonomonas sp. TaxID=206096 RepID=UPI001AD5CCDA|nr:hypothetical protein [uncultured Dysgonomonas sp.]MBN8786660.1 hypothetical protein [Terrimonas sp.]MBN8857093.1 hypothetical protein [Sphingobacteriales bacterium]